jgi:hypothetical protein
MKKDEFKNFVKSIILEVKKEKETPDSEKKKSKKDSNYLNQEKSKYRDNVDNDKDNTVQKLISQIKPIVKKIHKDTTVFLDDHNDIMVRYPGMFSIRINPKWSGMFDVEGFRNMSDRVYAIGLSNEQVIDFIKKNFTGDNKSYVQMAYDKVKDQTVDATKRKVKDLPKGETVKHMEVDEDDIEKSVTDKKDEPDAQMSVVNDKDVKRQEDFDVQKNKQMPKIQKMIKKEVDDDLTKNWKK